MSCPISNSQYIRKDLPRAHRTAQPEKHASANTLKKVGTHHDARKMGIQDPPILIVLPMHLQKVRPEILHHRLIVVRAFPKGCDAKFKKSQTPVRTIITMMIMEYCAASNREGVEGY